MPSDVASGDDGARHVLVIEDDPVFREAVRVRLSRAGYRVTLASDGQDGVQKAAAAHFDVILLDLVLPGMSGEEVLRALRPLGLRSRIVVLSAHSGAQWQASVRDLGAAAAIEKPISFSRLMPLLEQMTAPTPPGGSAGAGGAPDAWSGLIRFVFADPDVTPQKKVIGLAFVLGMPLLILWALFGKRI